MQLNEIKSNEMAIKCEAARANTMTGSLDLSFGFPGNGKIPYPPSGHLEPANQHAPSKKKKGNLSGES